MSWLDTVEAVRNKDFKKASSADRERAARDVINMCSYAAAAVAVSPIPFSEEIVMLPIQAAMIVTLGHIYGRKISRADARRLLVEIAAAAGTSFLARQGVKAILPIVGALLTMPAAYAANWAIGRVAIEHFKNPHLSTARIREIYAKAVKEGQRVAKKARATVSRKKGKKASKKR
jgi:uncharacterized protein (DUF697 family)